MGVRFGAIVGMHRILQIEECCELFLKLFVCMSPSYPGVELTLATGADAVDVESLDSYPPVMEFSHLSKSFSVA